MDQVTTYVELALSVVGSFALIATITPNKSDDKAVEFLLKVINLFAANVGKSKNNEE